MIAANTRNFARYTRELDFSVECRNRLFQATMIDYSLNGIGAVVNHSSLSQKNNTVTFSVQPFDMLSIGKVVWSKNISSGYRIGIRNTGQLKGHVRDFRLADTLIGLQKSQITGFLNFEIDDIVKTIYLKKGDMIFASSNEGKERIGERLARDGKLSPEKLHLALTEERKTQERLGKILVRLGYITPKELWHAVRHQVEDTILSLFILENGRLVLDETPLPAEETITLKLSAANLIYNGTKRINNFNRIRNELPPMDSILSFSSDPYYLYQELTLDHTGKKVISYIDNKSSIRDIIALTQLDGVGVLKTIYALLSSRVLIIRDKSTPGEDAPVGAGEEILSQNKEKKRDPGLKKEIEDIYQRLDNIGYYGVLGLEFFSPISEIKRAFYKTVKKFHPDIHFSLDDDSVKNKLSHIFSCINEAYRTLSDPQKKREYDKSLTIKPAKLTTNQDKAKVKFEKAKVLIKKHKYSDAVLLLEQALYYDRKSAEYHFYYGLVLIKQNKLKEGKRAIERALELEPFNENYVTELAFIYLRSGLYRRARSLFEKALSIAPDNIHALEGIKKLNN
jgi:curved DNA-binding protein CbpA